MQWGFVLQPIQGEPLLKGREGQPEPADLFPIPYAHATQG